MEEAIDFKSYLRLVTECIDEIALEGSIDKTKLSSEDKELRFALHNTIKGLQMISASALILILLLVP